MKKYIVVVLFLFSGYIQAQRNELGLFGGTSYYLGDLCPSRQFFLPKPAAGLFYRYIINSHFAIKFNGLLGGVEGSDAKLKFNENRNLSFKSNIFEISSQIELNFLPYLTGNEEKERITPYIFGGVALFSFNPKAEYDGTWYELRTLGTEGQGTSKYPYRKPYSSINLSFPFGLGFKTSIGKYISIGAEWGLRKTTTDYIDDVSTTYADPFVLAVENTKMSALLADRSLIPSNRTDYQRGNSKNKDWYSFAGVFVVFKIVNKVQKSCPAYKRPRNIYREYKRTQNNNQ